MIARSLLAAATLSLLPSAGTAQTSEYTDLDLDACEITRAYEEGAGADLTCPGLGDVAVFYSEGDLRADVDFGVRNESFDTFGGFNSVGERVEWRLDEAGEPFAAILRYIIETYADGDTEATRAEVLAISKVGTDAQAGCPVGYVDALANEGANRIARQVADAYARAFRCDRDRPTYLGSAGPGADGATAVQAP